MRLRGAGRRALSRWRALAVLGGLALAVLWTLVAAPAAQAGTFRISQCAAWDGTAWMPRAMQAPLWRTTGGWIDSSCGASGGRMAFVTPNYRLPNDGLARMYLTLLDTAAHTSIDGLWLDWTATAQAPSGDPAYASVWAGETLLRQIDAGDGTRPDAADRVRTPAGTRGVYLQLWCSPRDGPGWCNWSSPGLVVRGLSLDLEESADPAIEAGGSLLDGTAQRGTATLSLHASDADSGVRRVQAWLGGTELGDVDLGASCADDRLPVCPAAVARTLQIDTTRLPDGAARVRLRVLDAAGNAADVDAGRVEVDNVVDAPPDGGTPGAGTPPPAGGGSTAGGPLADPFPPNPLAGAGHVANGHGASEDARVIARLAAAGRTARRLTIAAARHSRVRGRLMARDGSPIGDALLTVVERIPGGRRRVAGVLRTRADGHYGGPLRAGPSRELAVVYRAYGDSPRARWSAPLRLAVRARVTLRESPGRGGSILHGRAAGRRPPDGVVVTIERRLGGRWVVAGRVRSDARGRFRRRAPGGARSVRATVLEQAGYPYATGSSRTLRLR
jgi:hypothetical protein